MNADTRDALARRYAALSAVAGCVAAAGAVCWLVGLIAGRPVEVVGLLTIAVAGTVSIVAEQLADRYREPLDDGGES